MQHLVLALTCLPFVACATLSYTRLPPEAARGPALVVQSGHAANVSDIAVSPDGKYMVSSDSSVVIVWDKQSGRQLRTLAIGSADLRMRFSLSFMDATTLVVSGREGMVAFDVRSGARLGVAPGVYGSASASLWLADHMRQSRVFLLDPASNTTKASIGVEHVYTRPVFSQDGRYAAYADLEELCVLDTESGREVLRKRLGTNAKVVAVSGDAVAAGSDDFSLRVYDFSGSLLWQATPNESYFQEIRFDPSGQTLAYLTMPGKLHRVDAKTGRELGPTLDLGGEDQVQALSFSPDGSELLVGNRMDVVVYDAKSLAVKSTFVGRGRGVSAIAMSDDGTWLIVDHTSQTMLWDLREGRAVRNLIDRGSKKIAISKAGRVLALDFGTTARVVELATGKQLSTITVKDRYADIAMSPDGKRVIVAEDDVVRFYDAESGARMSEIETMHDRADVAYSPDGTLIALGVGNHLKLYDAATLTVKQDHDCGVGSVDDVAFSSSGNAVVCMSSAHAEVFDVASGQRTQLIDEAADSFSWRSVALSPDGARVYVSDLLYDRHSSLPRGVHAYEQGRLVLDLLGQTGYFDHVLARGNIVASSSSDSTVKLWDARTGKEHATIAVFTGDDWVAVSPDGRFDGSEKAIGSVYFVDGDRVLPIEATFERSYSPRLLGSLLAGGAPSPPVASPVLVTPPRVVLTSKAPAETSDAAVTVRIETSAGDAAITEVRLFHNGKQISDATRGLKSKGSDVEITLIAGVNEVFASAVDQGGIEGRSAVLRIVRSAPKASARLFIIAVGVDQYVNPKYQLSYAKKDAKAVVETLSARGKGIFSEVIKKELYDADASRTAIEAALREVGTTSKPEDVLVFFYAGHGVMSETAPADFHLVLADVKQMYGSDDELSRKGLPAKVLKDLIVSVPARKTLLLLDACESGSAVDTFAMRGAAEEKAIFQLARTAGVVVLAATGATESAGEIKALGHGVFTYALLEGLKGAADGAPKDDKITVKELEAFISDQVPNLTEQYRGSRQIPSSFARGQDFPVGVK